MIITEHPGQVIAAMNGMVSTTPVSERKGWLVEVASYAAVWRMQQPNKSFEALTTSVYDYLRAATVS
jgi:hypothetical protein